jgi:hypothetical protein
MLDLVEFTARIDTALAARTRGELNAVLLDLPGVTNTEQATQPRYRPEKAAPAELVLRGSMSSLRRRGDWLVPRRLVVHHVVGGTVLDFTQARIEHPEVSIELDVAVGSVKLRVPRTASVAADGVQVLLGAVQQRRRPGGAGQGSPHFEVTGIIRVGSLVIRRPWDLLG